MSTTNVQILRPLAAIQSPRARLVPAPIVNEINVGDDGRCVAVLALIAVEVGKLDDPGGLADFGELVWAGDEDAILEPAGLLLPDTA